MTATAPSVPVEHTDPVNAQILAVSEDQIKGFHRHPFHFIAEKSGVPLETVLERIRAMLRAGVIRRVRQTFLANKLADGGLVAWDVPDGEARRGVRFHVQGGPLQRPCRDCVPRTGRSAVRTSGCGPP